MAEIPPSSRIRSLEATLVAIPEAAHYVFAHLNSFNWAYVFWCSIVSASPAPVTFHLSEFPISAI